MAVKKKAAPASGDSLAQVEEFLANSYGALGVKRFQAWLYAYFHPYQAYPGEKKNADMGNSTVTLAFMGLVQAVVAIIVMALALAFPLPMVGVPITLVGAVTMLIAYPIGSVVFGLIGALVYYIVAKVLGGKGSFWEQTYCMALVGGGMALVMAPLSVLQMIPLIGGIFGLLGLVVVIYGLISQYRMIRAVHSLSQLRAAVVLVLPIVLIMAVIMLVGMAFLVGLAAYFTAAPPAMG